jgi:tRNA pseudouridine55 synthase
MPIKDNPVSGLLVIDKPKGMTSHDVVNRVRRLSGQRKVGHTGTLDPMATGVLLVCLGQATRLIEYLMKGHKQYRATIRFGVTTDTLDAEGKIINQQDISALTEVQLRNILPKFIGEIEQYPPLFSALKKNGQPLYKLARAGEMVEVDPRLVTIYSLTWSEWRPPDLTVNVTCSAGTYIRSLARDIGEAAGTGASLVELTRTVNAGWDLSQAVSLETLEHEAQSGRLNWQKYLYPLDQAISHLPKIILDEATSDHVKYGRQIKIRPSQIERSIPNHGEVNNLRAYTTDGTFLAILTPVKTGEDIWQPKKVFQTNIADS